jgi:RHS repeat-associated protein
LTLSYGPAEANHPGLDRLGRVVEQKWTVAQTAVDHYQYGYDRASSRVWRKNVLLLTRGELYAYDELDRLVRAGRGTLNDSNDGLTTTVMRQEWDLSAVGNWRGFREDSDASDPWDSNQVRTHDKANEITGIDGSSARVGYDPAGNMTKAPRASDPNLACRHTFDAWNRLVKVETDDAQPALVAEYRYDGRNFRIAKVLPNEGAWRRTDYHYNEAWQVVEERQADAQADPNAVAGTMRAQYVWDLRYIDAPVCRFRDTTGDGNADETLYYTGDAQMNVTALVEPSSGLPVERYVYDPYGKPGVFDANWTIRPAGSAYVNEILYCGYRYDPETWYYDVRYRKYLWHMGCWGQVDPYLYADGANYYLYCVADPTNAVDPMGLLADGESVARVDKYAWIARGKLNDYKEALSKYAGESAKIRKLLEDAEKRGDDCPDIDLEPLEKAQAEGSDRFNQYIAAQADMWWWVHEFWKESKIVLPWEKWKLEWLFGRITMNPHPWRLIPPNDEVLRARWEQWRPSYKGKIDAADAEVRRVMGTTNSWIDWAADVQQKAEAATAVLGVGYAVRKVGAKAVIWALGKETLKEATIGQAVTQTMRSAGLSDEQVKALRVGSSLLSKARLAGVLGKGGKQQINAAPSGTAAAERAKNTAKGIPESELGPSGKPKIHVVEHSTQKQAKDAARAEVGKGGTTVKHPSPEEGGPHYHGRTQEGETSRIHHEYPE